MAWYSIENKEKYGVNEIQFFLNKEKNVKLNIDMNWKWGVFYACLESAPISPDETVDIYQYFDEVQVDYLDSGTEEFSFYDIVTGEKLDDEPFKELIELYYDEGVNALYDNGFDEELDPEIWVEGGFRIEETDNPYEF